MAKKKHNKKAREIKEAIEIRRRGAKTLNREEGTYLLSHAYDPLIKRSNAGKELIHARNQFPSMLDQMVILMKSPDAVRRNVKLL